MPINPSYNTINSYNISISSNQPNSTSLLSGKPSFASFLSSNIKSTTPQKSIISLETSSILSFPSSVFKPSAPSESIAYSETTSSIYSIPISFNYTASAPLESMVREKSLSKNA